MATSDAVDKIVGHPLGGTSQRVVGVPVSSIGRTARLDCYYGVPDGQNVTAALVTIGVSTYTDAAAATARVTSTVNDARTAQSKISTTKIGTAAATLMISQQNQALAVADGTRTVTVTANTGVLPQGNDLPQLTALIQLGLAAHTTGTG